MSENPPVNARTILLRAAQVMKQRGWCQGALYGNNGEVCLLGAIDVVIQGMPLVSNPEFTLAATKALEDLTVTVKMTMGDPHFQTAFWNDRVCSSEEEAIAMLERAAGVDD